MVQCKTVLWDKVSDHDKVKYKRILDYKLADLSCSLIECNDLKCKVPSHLSSINELSDGIVNACLEAAELSLPSKTFQLNSSFKQSSVPGWIQVVEPYKRDALFWHAIWKSCGSPHVGVVAGLRRRTRALYHKAVKKCKRMKELHASNSMASSLSDKDYKSFWENVKKQTRYKSCVPSSIDNAKGADEISDLFATSYKDLYNSAPYDKLKMSNLITEFNCLVGSKCQQGLCHNSHVISVNDVTNCVKLLKANKTDGNEGLNSFHILQGTETLFAMIAHLSTSMLCHGYASPNICLSTIIPIVKNKKSSLNDSSNYRGIALSSIIAKIIDILIIQSHDKNLVTSDLQFGFKQKSSTAQCTFAVNEIVNYYVSNESNVYATFLDASKAFDRVQYECLFKILLERNFCATVARLLAFIYTKQLCRINWANSISESFTAQNGVKQGGVLSPLLFNIYIDILLQRLKDSGIGCHIGTMFMGCIAYADDIVLLSPSLSSLNEMLSICDTYSKDFNITFNASKSKLVVFGKNRCNVNVKFQGSVIPQTDREKHVGNLIGTDPGLEMCIIQSACNDLYGKVNLLFRQLGNINCSTLYQLFKNFCMSFYGCQLWNFSSAKLLEPVYIAWRKCVRRIFKLSNMTHCNLVHLICQDLSITTQLHKRFFKFFIGACRSKNECVKLASRLVLNGSMSKTSQSLNYICSLYDMDRFNVLDCKLPCIIDVNLQCNEAKAGLIRDLILYRDDNPNDHEVCEIIESLCIN